VRLQTSGQRESSRRPAYDGAFVEMSAAAYRVGQFGASSPALRALPANSCWIVSSQRRRRDQGRGGHGRDRKSARRNQAFAGDAHGRMCVRCSDAGGR
jgi:hypothetical protein